MMHLRSMRPMMAIAIASLSLLAGCRPAPGGGSAAAGGMVVSRTVVSEPPASAPALAFFVLENRGTANDTLLAVSSPDADSAVLHTVVGGQMQRVARLLIVAGGTVRLHPGGYHLMIEGLHRELRIGDTVTLALSFARAGQVLVQAPVLQYSQAVNRARR